MRLSDQGDHGQVHGWPLRVQTNSGVVSFTQAGSVVRIPLLVSARGLRETGRSYPHPYYLLLATCYLLLTTYYLLLTTYYDQIRASPTPSRSKWQYSL